MRKLDTNELTMVAGGSVYSRPGDITNLDVNAREVCDNMGLPDSSSVRIESTIDGSLTNPMIGRTGASTTITTDANCGDARDHADGIGDTSTGGSSGDTGGSSSSGGSCGGSPGGSTGGSGGGTCQPGG